jgi:hypothetical protein
VVTAIRTTDILLIMVDMTGVAMGVATVVTRAPSNNRWRGP